MSDAADRCRVFRQLHESGCFVIPNPWDVGSARLLAQLGFPALATTSSGFAWSLGKPDNRVSLEEALAHFRAIAHARRGAGQRGLRRRFRHRRPLRSPPTSRPRRPRGSPASRSRIPPAMRRTRCSSSRSRSSAFGPPAGRSTTAEPAFCSPADPKASSSDVRISPKRSAGSRPTRRREPNASTRRASAPRPTSRRWSARSPRPP